jgi:hypothetical protein
MRKKELALTCWLAGYAPWLDPQTLTPNKPQNNHTKPAEK